MSHETAAESHVPARRERSDLFGITFLAALGIVMLVWIGGLIWTAIAFFNWLVS